MMSLYLAGIVALLLLAACGPTEPQQPAPVETQAEIGVLPPTPQITATSAATAPAPPRPAPATGTPAMPATATAELASPTVPATSSPTSTPTPLPTPCAEPGRIEQGTFSSVTGGQMAYRAYLPPCYGMDGRVYPALYLLGGNIHDDSIWDRLGADEAAETAIRAGEIAPMVIIMPDGSWVANQTSGGPGSFESVVVEELIPQMEQAYCLWNERTGRAIGGLSRGGYWSLEIAFRHAPLFRSAAAHSPALIDSHAGPDLDPVYTGVANDLQSLRIWLDIGERDPYLVHARPLHDALTGAGVEHVWQVNPGTHEEAYWIANLPAYLAWYGEGWPVDRSALPACPATN